MQNTDLQTKLQRQIEYYLGDDNLKNDEFFHSELSKADDGLIPLTILTNCKKIQMLNPTTEQLKEAIKASDALVISEDGERFGRKTRRLPKLRTSTLVVLTDENEAEIMANKEMIEDENVVLFKPVIIGFKCDQGIYYNNRELEKRLSKDLGLEVSFVKTNKKNGVMVINMLKAESKTLEELLDKKSLRLKKFQFNLNRLDNEEVKTWLENNKKDMELALKVKLGVKVYKALKPVDDAKNGELSGAATLGGMTFATAKALKDYLKLVINMTKNGGRIKEKDEAVLKDLFKYHPSKKDELAQCKEVYVDIHPEYKTTRCYFAVLEDGSKLDVSFHKCLAELIGTNN